MKLYNTLIRDKSNFTPLNNNEVKIYSCGPTVYNYAHIGNLRSYLFMDILRRILKYNGYKLKHVMNITDVGHLVSDSDEGEDKLIMTAKEEKKSPWAVAEYYTDVFYKDIKALNIERPEIIARATDHIEDMIEFVKGLVEKGYGYETSDGIYFDIQKFKGYGKLSGTDLDDLMPGARIKVNEEKHHPADFALWKKAPKKHIMQWSSPWGMGYPGWHIECSAMAKKYLGDEFDIHTGGVDHIPIHHENEIAQTEALLGKPSVKRWMHGEFLLVDNGKMSKSLGNVYTVRDIREKGYSPLAFRYMCLNAHYRNKLNFTWEGMKSAQVAYNRLLTGALTHKNSVDECLSQTEITSLIEKYKQEFEKAVNDDLNVPKALGVVWSIVRNEKKSGKLFDLLLEMDSILGLNIADAGKKSENNDKVSKDIMDMIQKRENARKKKNFKLADEIRDKLNQMGINLEDTPQGVKWSKK